MTTYRVERRSNGGFMFSTFKRVGGGAASTLVAHASMQAVQDYIEKYYPGVTVEYYLYAQTN